MSALKAHNPARRERGTVLVMVVGVLAMLFIIGSALLVVGRFEGKNAQTRVVGRDAQGAIASVIDPLAALLREDIVGNDDIAYNRWGSGDTSAYEDWEDYPGYVGNVRNGDLLTGSAEPYWDGSQWRWFASSYALDGPAGGVPGLNSIPAIETFGPSIGNYGDADGDGISDSSLSAFNLTGIGSAFGERYRAAVRIEAHGGKVMIDPLTHPTLLAQVINRVGADKAYHEDPSRLWTDSQPLSLNVANDERHLRRRFILPPTTDGAFTESSLQYKLPATLGLASFASFLNPYTPHWWPVDSNVVDDDIDWFHARMTPGDNQGRAFTDAGYNANRDYYDRRHLITTLNRDDLLRRQRDEGRIRDISPALYDILNPSGGATAPPYAYGLVDFDGDSVANELLFNSPGLRTQFSLRDVLEPLTGSGSERRAMQLTAYFLAMIQHTDVPGTQTGIPTNEHRAQQLRIAAQLAVNTIDFADADMTPSYFTIATGGTTIEVIGVEKQPFITEAYARIEQPAIDVSGNGDYEWQDFTNTNPSDPSPVVEVFAVELYNPYDVAIPLNEADGSPIFKLMLGKRDPAVDSFALPGADLKIPPFSYMVITNAAGWSDLGIDPASFDPALAPYISLVPGISALAIRQGEAVQLVRAGVNALNGTAPAAVVVDRLAPSDVAPESDPATADEITQRWARAGFKDPGSIPADDPFPDDDDAYSDSDPVKGIWKPTLGTETLVWDSSLQRCKEPITPAGAIPHHWRFTLARQIMLPLRAEIPACSITSKWLEIGADPGAAEPHKPQAADITEREWHDDSRPYQHSLIWTGSNPLVLRTQDLVQAEFDGMRTVMDLTPDPCGPLPSRTVNIWYSDGNKTPVAPFPIVTSDRGILPGTLTGGAGAFPTTGSLLLVTRYAHARLDNGGTYVHVPVTERATWDWNVTDYLSDPPPNIDDGQIRQIDNGHLPLFDMAQTTQDGNNTRLRNDQPWGRLIYDYFTALPLEELVRWRGAEPPLAGVAPEEYENMYFGKEPTNFFQNEQYMDFRYYPLVEQVSGAGSLVGPRVRGRINVNYAPWWVLDGLPVLPDAAPSPDGWTPTPNSLPMAGPGQSEIITPISTLPVPELLTERLDPGGISPPNAKAGARFVRALIDEHYGVPAPPPTNYPMPSISPVFAKYIVSRREAYNKTELIGGGPSARRIIVNRMLTDPNSQGLLPDGQVDGYWYGKPDSPAPHDEVWPGFVSVGALSDVVHSVRWATLLPGTSTFLQGNLAGMRTFVHTPTSGPETRPFSYLGYLHLVTPMVRLQDWATVKNHVFTIHATVRADTDPPISLRTQVTVDRSRCLYSPNELPVRVSEIEPISYYNAIDD